jgi:beta-galactosidase
MGGLRGDYREGFRTPRSDVEQLMKFVTTYDYVAGDHMWTGIDYLGEARWPGKSNPSGVLDTCGFEKDGYFFYQSQWTDKPMVHLLPHWNWKGREGEVIPVICYTNCDTVELFLNGRSFGVQGYWFPRSGMMEQYDKYPARNRAPRTTSDLHLSWTAPYQAGTLRAVGSRDGKVVATAEIATAGDPAAIDLTVDRETLAANRRDVAHVVVRILDAQGRVVPTADNEIAFEIQGQGKIIGLDNGNPVSHESYKGTHRKAFNGLCLAIVQSTATPGRIRLSASAPGIKAASVVLATRTL